MTNNSEKEILVFTKNNHTKKIIFNKDERVKFF